MTSERRPADSLGIETPDTGYTYLDNPNPETSATSKPDTQALDEAFQEEKNTDLDGIDPTQSVNGENLVDRQLGIISRMSG